MKRGKRSVHSLMCAVFILALLIQGGPVICQATTQPTAYQKTGDNIIRTKAKKVSKHKPKLNKKNLTLEVGKKYQLRLKYAKGKVIWKSAKRTVVRVNKKGQLRAIKKGNTIVYARYKGKKYKCKITVIDPQKPKDQGQDDNQHPDDDKTNDDKKVDDKKDDDKTNDDKKVDDKKDDDKKEDTELKGSWQLKTTTEKIYIILGTDDDNNGNAKYFRLLRTYDFPYTMNVEAENVLTKRALGSDVDTAFFTDKDAPALFPEGVDIVTLGKYIETSGLGEVAQHGISSKTLWDSNKLTGTFFENLYTTYTSNGGKKSEEDLKAAIKEQLKSTDCSQDASYVEESRKIIEDAMGIKVNTVGIWGGSPKATVDGITLNLNSIKTGATYNYMAHNYISAGTVLGYLKANKNSYDICRLTYTDSKAAISATEKMMEGKAYEVYWHVPFKDMGGQNLREYFDFLKKMESEGKLEVVTRRQYVGLGEFTENPITSISVTRKANASVGEKDSNQSYLVSVTFADGSVKAAESDVIINRSLVDTSKAGSYPVTAKYRGFTAQGKVLVQ